MNTTVKRDLSFEFNELAGSLQSLTSPFVMLAVLDRMLDISIRVNSLGQLTIVESWLRNPDLYHNVSAHVQERTIALLERSSITRVYLSTT